MSLGAWLAYMLFGRREPAWRVVSNFHRLRSDICLSSHCLARLRAGVTSTKVAPVMPKFQHVLNRCGFAREVGPRCEGREPPCIGHSLGRRRFEHVGASSSEAWPNLAELRDNLTMRRLISDTPRSLPDSDLYRHGSVEICREPAPACGWRAVRTGATRGSVGRRCRRPEEDAGSAADAVPNAARISEFPLEAEGPPGWSAASRSSCNLQFG